MPIDHNIPQKLIPKREIIIVEGQSNYMRFQSKCYNPIWYNHENQQDQVKAYNNKLDHAIISDVNVHCSPWRKDGFRITATLTMNTKDTWKNYAICLWDLPNNNLKSTDINTNAKEFILVKDSEGSCNIILYFDMAPDVNLYLSIPADVSVASVLTTDGKYKEGRLVSSSFDINVDGQNIQICFDDVLSVQFGHSLSSYEQETIQKLLPLVDGASDPNRNMAMYALTEIGLPCIDDILAKLVDMDYKEPKPLYNLFERIMPPGGDHLDRKLDMVRLKNGTIFRGKLATSYIRMFDAADVVNYPIANIRRIAIRQKKLEKDFGLQSLIYSIPIDFADTGIILTEDSNTRIEIQGLGV